MPEYIPPALDWVRKQVELYESSGGTEGTTLMETGMPCVLITHLGNKSGGIRKIPLMRVKVGNAYALIGSYGGRPKDPVWVHNLRAAPLIALRDGTEIWPMILRELPDGDEYDTVWAAGVADYPPYDDYKAKTDRRIPVFMAEPV